jgi:phosphatidylinositol glycan class Q protein
MTDHDGLMRVFWPTDVRESDRPGVVVGWRNSTLDVFVVAVLDDVEVLLCPYFPPYRVRWAMVR